MSSHKNVLNMKMSSRNLRNDKEIDFIIKERFIEPYELSCYKGIYLPKNYIKFIELIENFEVREDDIWLCNFPISGM